MNDEVTMGEMSTHWNAILDWQAPWHRQVSERDARLNPIQPVDANAFYTGVSRRMRHPFLADIIYPRVPDDTFNFDQDPTIRTRSVVTKTLGASAVTKFQEGFSDVVVREVWAAEQLSTTIELARQFYKYHSEPLPVGQFIGWRPTDLSPKNFAIEILDVQIGRPDAMNFKELGPDRPYYSNKVLVVSFKMVREDESPTGALVVVGN